MNEWRDLLIIVLDCFTNTFISTTHKYRRGRPMDIQTTYKVYSQITTSTDKATGVAATGEDIGLKPTCYNMLATVRR